MVNNTPIHVLTLWIEFVSAYSGHKSITVKQSKL